MNPINCYLSSKKFYQKKTFNFNESALIRRKN